MKEKVTCDTKNNQCYTDLVFIVQLENFISDNDGGLGSAAEAGRNAVEAARADLEWTKNHKDEILGWLVKEPTPEPTTAPVELTTEPTTTTQGTSSLSLSPAVCMTLFLSCLYQILTTFKVQ